MTSAGPAMRRLKAWLRKRQAEIPHEHRLRAEASKEQSEADIAERTKRNEVRRELPA